jgi:predicted nucleic acid-binding protein
VPATAYIDSSALLKLVIREAETPALEAYLARCDGVVASRLAVIECLRAVRRAARARLLQTVEQVLEAVYLLEITPVILEEAAMVGSPLLRTFDAIHLATALSVDDPELAVIVYDERLAEAVRAERMTVVQPGVVRRASGGRRSG